MEAKINLDAVLEKAAWLKGLADQYRGQTGMTVTALLAPQDAFGQATRFGNFTLFGLPVYSMGEKWALVVEPEQADV